MPDTLPDVQAEKLRQWALGIVNRAMLQEISDTDDPEGDLLAACGGVRGIYYPEGFVRDAEQREYVITVQPKGLAELQEGLIADVRDLMNRGKRCEDELCDDSAHERTRQIQFKLDRYDAALASLGMKDRTS